METAVRMNRWLTQILCPQKIAKVGSCIIPTIWVDSPTLTTSYYKLYLGFTHILTCPVNGSILLKKENNWLLVKSKNKEFQNASQRIVINSKDLMLDYSNISNKVWVVKPYKNNLLENFVVKDCNGIEIEYCPS